MQMRRRVTKQQIALTVGLLTVVVAAGYWWSPHIWWAYMVSRTGAKVPSIPVTTLQGAGQTQGWFTCTIGPLSFKLPPEIAEEADRSVAKKNKSMISLKTPAVELLVFVPYQAPAGAQPPLLQMATQLHLSPMEMIVESFRASTDDFRWTMSRADLQRHQILLNLGYMYPHLRGTKVESRLDGSQEGLLMIHDKTHATFEWHIKSGTAGGVMAFTATVGDLNLDKVRDICASVTVDDARLGPPPENGDVSGLVDAIEITKDE
jgi:hypothetical protein